MSITKLANQFIPAAKNIKQLQYKNGETRDIIKEVLATYNYSKGMLDAFAVHLKGINDVETCRNIYHFWKSEIRYQIDPDGVQWAKTPAAVWASKYCDCKSFSIAVGTTLQALGIPFTFRFTSYGSNTSTPTHVYIVAHCKGKDVIMDCVWHMFNKEKNFTKNWDYMSTAIYRISGIEEEQYNYGYAIGELNIEPTDDNITQAELDIALSKQSLELEQAILQRKKGISGTAYDTAYDIEIGAHDDALAEIAGLDDDYSDGVGAPPKKKPASKPKANVKSKQAIKVKATKAAKTQKGMAVKAATVKGKKAQAKAAKAATPKAEATKKKRKGGLLKKVGAGLKKVVSKVALAVIKKKLPSASPFFLYLFIDPTNNALIAALPEAVRIKRQKAIKYKKLIVDKLGMKPANFDTTVRNGIMDNFAKAPEAVLGEWMKTAGFTAPKSGSVMGIGVIPAMVAQGASMLKGLLGQAGANLQADLEKFAPDPSDFSSTGASPELRCERTKLVKV